MLPQFFLKRNAIEHYKLTNMVLAMMVAVEMDNKQLASRHVVVIRQVVAINSKNSSACFLKIVISEPDIM